MTIEDAIGIGFLAGMTCCAVVSFIILHAMKGVYQDRVDYWMVQAFRVGKLLLDRRLEEKPDHEDPDWWKDQ